MSEKPLILSTGNLPNWFTNSISNYYKVNKNNRIIDLIDEASTTGIEALLVRSGTTVDAGFLNRLPDLKIIARAGVGLDSIDVAAATNRQIPVIYAPNALTHSVAEHTAALILAAVKHLPVWNQRLLQQQWKTRDSERSGTLENSVLGLIGFGRIGRRLFELLEPFGTNTLVYDPYTQAPLPDGVRSVDLRELLETSDVVSLHLPLDTTTRHLINRDTVRWFKPGATFVNASRGQLVENSDILWRALLEGQLSFLALDTHVEEPPDLGHPLYRHPHTLFTPHVGARTESAQRSIFESLLADLTSLQRGEMPTLANVANPEVL